MIWPWAQDYQSLQYIILTFLYNINADKTTQHFIQINIGIINHNYESFDVWFKEIQSKVGWYMIWEPYLLLYFLL